MEPKELKITPVSNGFIISPKIEGGHWQDSLDLSVFESASTLADFIVKYYQRKTYTDLAELPRSEKEKGCS